MRPNHPCYWAAKNAWFVELGNTRHRLGKQPEGVSPPRMRKRGDPPSRPPEEIEKAYHRLMATANRKLPEASNLRVATVCDLFLDFSEKHHTPETYLSYKTFLQDFCDTYGTLLAKDLNRRNAVVSIKRAFNWADAEGLLQPNPIKAVKKPPRNRDCLAARPAVFVLIAPAPKVWETPLGPPRCCLPFAPQFQPN